MKTVFSLSAFEKAGKPADLQAFLRLDAAHAGRRHRHRNHVNSHGDAATAYCFTADAPIAFPALSEALAVLQASFGADLLRLKRVIDIADAPGHPLVIHVAGHTTGPPRRPAALAQRRRSDATCRDRRRRYARSSLGDVHAVAAGFVAVRRVSLAGRARQARWRSPQSRRSGDDRDRAAG